MFEKVFTWTEKHKLLTFLLGLIFLVIYILILDTKGFSIKALGLVVGPITAVLLVTTGHTLACEDIFYKGLQRVWGYGVMEDLKWETVRHMLAGAAFILPLSTPYDVIDDLYFLVSLAETRRQLFLEETA